jgi:adenosylcobyric acid synthase
MVVGCSSTAGKSLIVTALARWFARQGVDVAPFKAQNMSNNARVVAGGEIGVAQWLQARAAGIDADVRMNPVLLKPEGDGRSQVVVCGHVRHDLTAMPWRERPPHLWPVMQESFDALRRDHDLVLIEGAGSPAEINLPDLVNNRVLAHADAAAALVVDIDRGGAFAHLVGTWTLVPETTRDRLRGFILNRFRGDPALLEPGPSAVTQRTGMDHLGVVPMLTHDLPDEEGATIRSVPQGSASRVVVVRYPYGSNLDELSVLARAAHVELATHPAQVDGADLVVLPGSKHVAADVEWMRRAGFDEAVSAAAARGTRILGICGGAMMLGGAIRDPHGIEGEAIGLGLLPLETVMSEKKVVERVGVRLHDLPEPWSALEARAARGYEIRNGRVDGPACRTGDARVWGRGAVLATTVHGLLEDPDVVEAVVGVRPSSSDTETFDLLADAIDEHLDTRRVWELVRS